MGELLALPTLIETYILQYGQVHMSSHAGSIARETPLGPFHREVVTYNALVISYLPFLALVFQCF
jgi:hypothetical protein